MKEMDDVNMCKGGGGKSKNNFEDSSVNEGNAVYSELIWKMQMEIFG